jgi:formate dehydrogenase maturation protein FdhE
LNIAHIIVVQQMLVYKLSDMMIFRRWSRNIKKGTKPEDIATQSEVDEIQLLLMETINQTESDLENKILLIIKNTQHLQGLY